MIYISRSQYSATDHCWRARWLGYEAPNGTSLPTICPKCGDYFVDPQGDTVKCPRCGVIQGIVRGWQRKSQSIPLSTGQYVHRGLASILMGDGVLDAALAAADAYRIMAYERGLDAFGDVSGVIEEQATLIAGLVYAWGTVRWPDVRREWEVVHVEREGVAGLADDMTLQYRADWIGKRRADGQHFVWNFKTLSMLDERWLKGWEIDPQVLTEAWAVEHDLSTPVAGVIIEGLIKGTRRKDKDEFGQVIGERQQSPICYGYFQAGNPPITPAEYSSEYKRGRGWQRFIVGSSGHPSVNEWIDALPGDVREGLFVAVPPVYRNDAKVASKLVQIVSREREVARKAAEVRADPDWLDINFPQNERSCLWPSRCQFFDACHTENVGADMAGSGMYQAREANHPVLVAED